MFKIFAVVAALLAAFALLASLHPQAGVLAGIGTIFALLNLGEQEKAS